MIERCSFDDVAHFRNAPDGPSVKQSRDTDWFRVVVDGETVGCGALLNKGGVGRIKAIYVRPDHRGGGLGHDLNMALIDHAFDLGLSAVEAYARNPGWYDRHGFRRIGERPNGAVHVILNL